MPADLILDVRIFANAKIVYALLKTFPTNIVKVDLPSSLSTTPIAISVTVTHSAIIERSGLSRHTIVKSLNREAITIKASKTVKFSGGKRFKDSFQ